MKPKYLVLARDLVSGERWRLTYGLSPLEVCQGTSSMTVERLGDLDEVRVVVCESFYARRDAAAIARLVVRKTSRTSTGDRATARADVAPLVEFLASRTVS